MDKKVEQITEKLSSNVITEMLIALGWENSNPDLKEIGYWYKVNEATKETVNAFTSNEAWQKELAS